jgi:hypothetical protein
MPDVRGGLLARQANISSLSRGQELRSYSPTIRDRLLAGLLGESKPSPERRRISEGLIGTPTSAGVIDVTPGGVPLAIQEAARAGDAQGVAMSIMPMPAARRAAAIRRMIPKRTAGQLSKLDAENAVISATRSNYPPGQLASGAAPDRSGYTLIRHRAPKGDSARFKSLEKKIAAQPSVKAEMMQLARDGEDIGRRWYNTEALRERFQGVLGAKDGDAAWREYMWLVGTTSSGAKVPSNIRMASHYYVQNSQQKLGRLADDLMAGRYDPPEGYGHKMQKTQARNVAKAVTGEWGPHGDPALNPKPRGFLQSLLGNETNIAADKHFMRLMGMMSDDPQFLHGAAEISQELRTSLRAKYGKKVDKFLFENEIKNAKGNPTGKMRINFNAKKAVREGPKGLYDFIKGQSSVWDDMPNANEYAAFERIANKMAKELNMTGPQFQASLWMGAAKKTKVDPSSLDTFVNLFNKRVSDAAAERGRTPEDVFRRFATRKEALAVPLGLLGAGTVGGGLLNQQD